MTVQRFRQGRHSTARVPLLKATACMLGLWSAVAAFGQAGDSRLRDELADFLRQGTPDAAIRRVQAALRLTPDDPNVRHEYVSLHLALARSWLAAGDYDACLAAVEAVRAVEPNSEPALALRQEIDAARARAGEYAERLDELLRIDLFEAALDRARELKRLRPDLAAALASREQAAWLGAADDHYLARNFHEAFALYEQVLATDPDASPGVCSRWAVSLALALAEEGFDEPMDPDAAGRLLARAIDVLRKTSEPIVGQVLGGLLAERAGQLIDAGRTYAEALGTPWELPPVDRRRERVAELRRQAVQRVRELYKVTPTRRREGMWTIALPDVWKQRQTPHFDVYARSDMIATRVAEALEYHYPLLAEWLGVSADRDWQPRLEVRVHATREDMQQATGTRGITHAVSHTRLKGDRVVLRKLEVFQGDQWLLSATLPHELTHALLADAHRRSVPPLAIDEGLALQAEPPARRLMYRRLLSGRPPAPATLLAAAQPPADLERFYAQADALTSWLLDRQGQRPSAAAQPSPVAAVIAALPAASQPEWWAHFGWAGEAEMLADWHEWYAARSNPQRMPLMILVEPSAEHRRENAADQHP